MRGYVNSTLPAGRSSNGRTPDSGSGYRGSSPCLPAKKNQIVTGGPKVSRPFLCAYNPLGLLASTPTHDVIAVARGQKRHEFTGLRIVLAVEDAVSGGSQVYSPACLGKVNRGRTGPRYTLTGIETRGKGQLAEQATHLFDDRTQNTEYGNCAQYRIAHCIVRFAATYISRRFSSA